MTNANFYYGRNKSVVFKIAEIHKYFMWILNRRKFKTIIYRTDYDLIHLNSMILSPIVSEKCKLILHVGEVFESMGGLVYEGMYSGCRDIFLGKREETIDFLQYDKLKNMLNFYLLRDREDLGYVIDQCVERPVEDR